MSVVLSLLAVAAILVLVAVLWVKCGPEAYHDAYRKAQQDDIDYVRAHPGCSLEEAHQHREKVNRRFWWRI